MSQNEHESTRQPAATPAEQPKTPHGALAVFDSPAALLAGARRMRELGYTKMDAFSPFPVHGIDEVLGIRRSPLGWLVLGGALTGCAAAILLQWWTGAVDYPLVIGGKPLFAFEFAVPIIFELSVLFASITAVFGMLILNGLPRFHHPVFNVERFKGASDDRFALVVEASDPLFESETCLRVLDEAGAAESSLVEDR